MSNVVKRIQTRPILINHVLKILSDEPGLSKINARFDPNEGIKKSKKEDIDFLKKE